MERARRRIASYPRRHPLGFAAAIVGLVVVIIGGWVLWNYFQSYESTDDAQVNGHLNPVAARISGTAIAVYTENNRSVVQNQTLVDLDPRDYQAAAEQARANLMQAQGQLAAANPNVPITETVNVTTLATSSAEVASAEAALAAAQRESDTAVADLRQAQANNAQAQADEMRYRVLVAKDEVSRELYDQRLAAARSQAAVVDARRTRARPRSVQWPSGRHPWRRRAAGWIRFAAIIRAKSRFAGRMSNRGAAPWVPPKPR